METGRLIITLLVLFGTPVETGYASQYAPLVMAGTVKVRYYQLEHITQEQIRAADAFIAVVDCRRIGEMGVLSTNGRRPITYLVVDCRQRDLTVRWFEENNIIVEVSFDTATDHEVAGQGGVKVAVIPDATRGKQ